MKALDNSWLSGKYSDTVEINTSLPFFSYNGFFAQGEEAEVIINEIMAIWTKDNCTQLEAIETWASNMLD